MKKRKVEVAVISDVHLGTYGCHAKELLEYLSSIKPKTLILNGDIIDIWQFRKSYFPSQHLEVIKKIISLSTKGTKIYYITGNHDEFLRKFTDLHMGNISLIDKLVLELDDKKAWIFHGDVFDTSITHAKWLAKLGGWGYDILILINRFVNWVLSKFNKEPYSLSKKIKNNVKSAVKFITNFENVCVDIAIENKFDYVICGHIHEPKIEFMENEKGDTMYLNSGDWIENLTALEYNNKKWKLYKHDRNLRITENEYNFEDENKLAEQFIAILKK
ncbi:MULTISPECIES: UDP-2,3-diacylglucosamine diphosphatase [unclassified Flavobacterium]|uniref:UDP-2,3-diacylglucosamine diphosphatase n=1 Tax=unclassified Flavobacterium TaxID=196869 RepID=UPI0012916A57|nr:MULTISPECIES: UDP-2,3-diacylglucosamine diphosphatase [unclassified Flavobacterium]MQP51263.1 UDP-2,3-diacylglucosamine diphosphatase [Flavobacterium sp. LMO9]MQP61508.1 UDP-2,3-diacylglucosamine diphosphatase [Flavobacterium sp. LMO6]